MRLRADAVWEVAALSIVTIRVGGGLVVILAARVFEQNPQRSFVLLQYNKRVILGLNSVRMTVLPQSSTHFHTV